MYSALESSWFRKWTGHEIVGCRTVDSVDIPLYMPTSRLYTGHKIDVGHYPAAPKLYKSFISGAGLGRLTLNSDSDRVDERRLIVVVPAEKAQP